MVRIQYIQGFTGLCHKEGDSEMLLALGKHPGLESGLGHSPALSLGHRHIAPRGASVKKDRWGCMPCFTHTLSY